MSNIGFRPTRIESPIDLARALGVVGNLTGLPSISQATDEENGLVVNIDLPGVTLTSAQTNLLKQIASSKGWGEEIE
jgi:hypothetical protein